MKTNADLSYRAERNINNIEWETSVMPGVLRKRLDQDESMPPIERVTTVVSFAPDSFFKPHTHDGGEEFIVLEGVFSDQHADYPEGSYVRNPVGTRHKPFSKNGCTILVKLWQMQPNDQKHVVINTRESSLWKQNADNSKQLDLFLNDYEQNVMLKWPKGLTLNQQAFPHGVEYFVLQGSFSDDQGQHSSGGWLRLPVNSQQNITVSEDCLVYRKTGHLRLSAEMNGE